MGILTSMFGRAFGVPPAVGRVDREDSFVDVTLPITEQRWAKDGALTVIARGKINQQTVSFAVDLSSTWKRQSSEGSPIIVYWGNGYIRSVGAESDAFLSLLAKEYNLASPGQMVPRAQITMAGLNNDPTDLRKNPAKIKIFFESGNDASYGEAFINIDLGNRVLEFRDKDPEYHQGILLSLGRGT